jgi:hypothetical protein
MLASEQVGKAKKELELTERQLFKCATLGLREEEVDEYNLESQQAAVKEQPPPRYVFEANRVDIGGEEGCPRTGTMRGRGTGLDTGIFQPGML